MDRVGFDVTRVYADVQPLMLEWCHCGCVSHQLWEVAQAFQHRFWWRHNQWCSIDHTLQHRHEIHGHELRDHAEYTAPHHLWLLPAGFQLAFHRHHLRAHEFIHSQTVPIIFKEPSFWVNDDFLLRVSQLCLQWGCAEFWYHFAAYIWSGYGPLHLV